MTSAIDSLPRTRSFQWKKNHLRLLDQRLLPDRVLWRVCRTWEQVAAGIHEMVVRGAPAIGCVAAYGVVLAAQRKQKGSVTEQRSFLQKAAAGLLKARPTAVNLRWALERLQTIWDSSALAPLALSKALEEEAIRIEIQDRQANQAMGHFGADLLPSQATVMTICNTGSLATAGLGTALGVIWTAFQEGKLKKVLVSETRPYLQGARLTAYELLKEKIPFELMTDSMAAHIMNTEPIHAVLVGADRIAANGDTANKVGTYNLAI